MSVCQVEMNDLPAETTEKSRAEEITRLHGEVTDHVRTTMQKAIRIGELLVEQKKSMKHGGFSEWMQNNMPFTVRTGQNYMRLFKDKGQLKNENVSLLTEGYKQIKRNKRRENILREREERNEAAKEEWDSTIARRLNLKGDPEVSIRRHRAGWGNWECEEEIIRYPGGLVCEVPHRVLDPDYYELEKNAIGLKDYKKIPDPNILCSGRHVEMYLKKVREFLLEYKTRIQKVDPNAYYFDFRNGPETYFDRLKRWRNEIREEYELLEKTFDEVI